MEILVIRVAYTVSIHRIKPAALPGLLKCPGKHADGGGLYLQVARRGLAASWTYQYRFNKATHWLSIGPQATFTLAEAREAHHQMRRLRDRGIDPIEARRTNGHVASALNGDGHAPVLEIEHSISVPRQASTEATGLTFGEAVRTYIAEKTPEWTGGERGDGYRQWTRTLVTNGGKLHPLTLDKITPVAVQDFLAPLSAVQKIRVGARIAVVTEYMRTGVVKKAAPEVQHFPSMPYGDMPAFMTELATLATPAAKILAFTILTAARIGEVVGDKNGKDPLKWKEIEDNVWTLPAERAKKKRAHRVPLSKAALDLIGPAGAPDANVFPVGMTPVDKLQRKLAPKYRPDPVSHKPGTIHGHRSSFMVWCQDNAIDDKLAEAALSHYKGATYLSYARGDLFDRRRELMEAWSAFCGGVS